MALATLWQTFADNWLLIVMLTAYLGVFVWVIRPGSNRVHSEAASIPFHDDSGPVPEMMRPCSEGCAGCTCAEKEAKV